MKNKKTTILVFVLLIVAAALYRVWDNRPWGFAPQIAMALFAGSVIKDKRFSFACSAFFYADIGCFIPVFIFTRLNGNKRLLSWSMGELYFVTAITVIGFLINKNKVGSVIFG